MGNNERLSKQWMSIGNNNKNKLIDFIFNHQTNLIEYNEHYDDIQIPQHLISLLRPSKKLKNGQPSFKKHKVFIVDNVNNFIHIPSGGHFKKKRIKISDFSFKLHLFPNGLSQTNAGFVQYFIEFIAKPKNVKQIIVFLNLFCIETATKYKETVTFKATGDSKGWIWSLASSECTKFKSLQFGYDIEILQIHYCDTQKIKNTTQQFEINQFTEYKWPWKDVQCILHKIKHSEHDNIFF